MGVVLIGGALAEKDFQFSSEMLSGVEGDFANNRRRNCSGAMNGLCLDKEKAEEGNRVEVDFRYDQVEGVMYCGLSVRMN